MGSENEANSCLLAVDNRDPAEVACTDFPKAITLMQPQDDAQIASGYTRLGSGTCLDLRANGPLSRYVDTALRIA